MSTTVFKRGQIWMAELGDPVGTELGYEHPVVIISGADLIKTNSSRVICVPGTSKKYVNPRTGKLLALHLEVVQSPLNGLSRSTYFMSEQIRALSSRRFRRKMGMIELRLLAKMEEHLRFAMDLFEPV